MQTYRRRERFVAYDFWFYSGGSRTTIKLRWRPSILDQNSALNIKVPNPTCWVFVQLGRSPHEFPSLIPQRIWQGKPNACPLGKWCSDVFSLGKALFSFHCAFKDSIDSLILGVFLLDYVHICCWSPACRKSRRSWPRMPRVPRAKNHEEGNHDSKRWVAMIGSICSFFFGMWKFNTYHIK